MIHIIGGGPTGVTIAFYISNLGHEVHLWESKDTCGGSWWEPEDEIDMHSYRATFKDSWVNTMDLFNDMKLEWNDYFKKTDLFTENINTTLQKLSLCDYLAIIKVASKASFDTEWAKTISVRDAFENVSEGAASLLNSMTHAIDGVDWSRMFLWEFIYTVNTTSLSKTYTQGTSGRMMGLDMETVLRDSGVHLHFNHTLARVEYINESEWVAEFTNSTSIRSPDQLVLALDANSMTKFMGDNWGTIDVSDRLYSAMNILLEYDAKFETSTGTASLLKSNEEMYANWLYVDSNILCISYIPDDKNESEIVEYILKVLELPTPNCHKICWGYKWNGIKWDVTTASAVWSPDPLPIVGKCKNVSAVGMLSYRETTYASLEAAVEVGKRFVHLKFGGKKPLRSLRISSILLVILLLLLIFILIK